MRVTRPRSAPRSRLALAALATLASACAVPATPGDPAARTYTTGPGEALSRPSAAPAAVIVEDFLRDQTGVPATQLADLQLVRESRSLDGDRVHVELRQLHGGRRVAGGYVKATLDSQGRLLHAIEHLQPIPETAIAAPSINAEQALSAVLDHLGYGGAGTVPVTGQVGTQTTFEPGERFFSPPTVEPVYLMGLEGALVSGFEVETWTSDTNRLHVTLVDGTGRVVAVESRTQNDRYNVFVEDPLKGGQTIVSGPGAGNAQSPSGWLAGAQTTWNIVGNNVNAYLDTDANNRADKGGSAVGNGDFLTAADLNASPSTAGNKAVAVQNLFYLNNVIHDVLYAKGFIETEGNFQTSNFNKGGRGSDAVLAEAQDGSGTDNANFSTPSDGRAPRMQMYLWTGAGPTHEVVVNNVTYGAYGSSFGAQLTTVGVTFPLAVSATDGCAAYPAGTFTNKTAIIDRGACNFTVKVKNAQTAGAKCVLIANNAPTAPFAPGGTDNTVTIPSAMVTQADGATLKGLAGASAITRKKTVQPLMVDGDVDSDIVFHEYGHGLTWRMIGGMSGLLAGAIGEGASDVNAFLNNGDDIMGEYAISNPLGIRRYPYHNYPLTYSAVTGAEVHNDGEIYAGAMWRLVEAFQADAVPAGNLYRLFVDGMNYTPATPAFENMRDGMLQSDATLFAGANKCRIWRAFAASGIGVGAKGTATSSTVTITESFAVPPGC